MERLLAEVDFISFKILSIKRRIWPLTIYKWKVLVQLETGEVVSFNIWIDKNDSIDNIVGHIEYKVREKLRQRKPKPSIEERERQLKDLEGRSFKILI